MSSLRFSFRLFTWLARFVSPSIEVVGTARARAAMKKNTGGFDFLFGAPAVLADLRDEELGDVLVRRYTPVGATPGTIVYFHGGGWVVGDLDSHDRPLRHLCAQTGHEVISVDYRLAPEHPFPAAIDDALAVTRAVAARTRVVVAGDSAGGHLAAVVARHLSTDPALAGQLLVYPVTTCATESASYERFASGYFLTRATMRFYKDAFLPPGIDRRHPDASPLEAPPSRATDAYVLLASHDVLHDEGVAYAKKLEAEGATVTLDEVPGVTHGFFNLQGLPVSRAAMARAATWVKARLG
ncbi:MAG: alpha/beta hydrolase [Myxococcaceae bacterium]|jgi:acetyl esterase|nr:alpha/beta hydrolase [Myxococcaceae bacterium]